MYLPTAQHCLSQWSNVRWTRIDMTIEKEQPAYLVKTHLSLYCVMAHCISTQACTAARICAYYALVTSTIRIRFDAVRFQLDYEQTP